MLYIAFGPETRYIRSANPGIPPKADARTLTLRRQYFTFRRIDPSPLTIWDFFRPLAMAGRVSVVVPSVICSMIFLLGGVLLTIKVSQLFVVIFGLDTQQIGLQALGFIIGAILDEQIGGMMSDKWILRRERKGSPTSGT